MSPFPASATRRFDPSILDTGMGGRTSGVYNLTMSLKADGGTTSMRDMTGVALDGDAEGNPGGTYQFYFQSNTVTNTIYVDKVSTANQNPAQNPNLGTIGSPFNTAGRRPQRGRLVGHEEDRPGRGQRRDRRQPEHVRRRQGLSGRLQGPAALAAPGRRRSVPGAAKRDGHDRRRAPRSRCGGRT